MRTCFGHLDFLEQFLIDHMIHVIGKRLLCAIVEIYKIIRRERRDDI